MKWKASSEPILIAAIPKNKFQDVLVSLRIFKGHRLVHLQVVTRTSKGAEQAGGGINVAVILLAPLIEALQNAKSEAQRLGMVPSE